MKRSWVILISVTSLSCNEMMCGELTGEWKARYEKARVSTKKIRIQNIPCEFFYIRGVVEDKSIDMQSVHRIHNYLFNKENNVGWRVIEIYDVNNKYLFSHKYDSSVFIKDKARN